MDLRKTSGEDRTPPESGVASPLFQDSASEDELVTPRLSLFANAAGAAAKAGNLLEEPKPREALFGNDPKPKPITKPLFGSRTIKEVSKPGQSTRDPKPRQPKKLPQVPEQPAENKETLKGSLTEVLKNRRDSVSGKRGQIVGILVFLGTATQLRPKGGVGLPEIMLMAYMAASLPMKSWGLHLRSHRPGRFLLTFLVVTSLGGFFNSIVRGIDSPIDMLIAFLPYFLAAVVLEYCSAQPDPYKFLFSFSYVFGRLLLASQFILFVLPVQTLGPLDLYLGGIRFKGWSNNPNQIAVMIVIAVSAVGLTSDSKKGKLAALAVGVVLGYSTKSDAWLLAAGFGMVAAFVIGLVKGRRLGLTYRIMGWTAVICSVVLVVMASARLDAFATGVAVERGQGNERVTLWLSCVDETVESGVGLAIGLGPTPHGIATDGDDQECHSTPIDFLSFGGLGIVLMFAAMMFQLSKKAWESGNYWSMLFLVTFAIQMQFSFAARYPSLWIFLLFLTIASGNGLPPAEATVSAPATQRDLHPALVGLAPSRRG